MGSPVNFSDLPDGTAGWVGAGVAGIISVILGAQRAMKAWAGNARDIEKVNGEADVVSLLRGELGRMATQNDKLAALVNKLQSQLIDLTSKNARLNREIEMLTFEVKAMRGPVGLDT